MSNCLLRSELGRQLGVAPIANRKARTGADRNRTCYEVIATYGQLFTPQDKDAITPSMLTMDKARNGAATFAYPAGAERNLIMQREQSRFAKMQNC